MAMGEVPMTLMTLAEKYGSITDCILQFDKLPSEEKRVLETFVGLERLSQFRLALAAERLAKVMDPRS